MWAARRGSVRTGLPLGPLGARPHLGTLLLVPAPFPAASMATTDVPDDVARSLLTASW
jgi:hypothetical protein